MIKNPFIPDFILRSSSGETTRVTAVATRTTPETSTVSTEVVTVTVVTMAAETTVMVVGDVDIRVVVTEGTITEMSGRH